MSLEGRKNDSPTLEKSAIKLEKVPESAVILEKVLFSDLYKIVSLCSIFLLHQSKLS